MELVWETYHKGVPVLGVPGITFDMFLSIISRSKVFSEWLPSRSESVNLDTVPGTNNLPSTRGRAPKREISLTPAPCVSGVNFAVGFREGFFSDRKKNIPIGSMYVSRYSNQKFFRCKLAVSFRVDTTWWTPNQLSTWWQANTLSTSSVRLPKGTKKHKKTKHLKVNNGRIPREKEPQRLWSLFVVRQILETTKIMGFSVVLRVSCLV